MSVGHAVLVPSCATCKDRCEARSQSVLCTDYSVLMRGGIRNGVDGKEAREETKKKTNREGGLVEISNTIPHQFVFENAHRHLLANMLRIYANEALM